MTDTVTKEQMQAIIDGCEGVQGGPWKLDKFAAYVWAPSEKGGDFPLMDEPGEHGRVIELRGWGYYTGNGHGALGLDPDDAAARQRRTGEHVARLDPSTVRYITERAMMFDELVEGLQQIREMVDALGWSANTNTDHLTGPIDTLRTRAQSLNGGKNG